MACYHPLKAFQIGHFVSGKPSYKICSYNVDYIWKFKDSETWYKEVGIPSYSPRITVVSDFIEIPCGKCIGCRLKYSRDWANRCMLEAKEHEHSYFVTLTYNEETVRHRSYIDDETGECGDTLTLCKRDFQLFMKRLRKYYKYDNKLRFFMCGEYGNKTLRPHYHVIIFGLKLDDLVFYKKSCQGFNYYNSEFLSNVWKLGHVVITDLTWETCAYTARYVMKKANGQTSDWFVNHNMESEFVLMSRKPGIARNYFDMNFEEIYETDELIFSTSHGGKCSKPPRYFDKLFEQEVPELYAQVKENRADLANSLRKIKLENTDLSYLELLEIEEQNKLSSIKSLKRIEI